MTTFPTDPDNLRPFFRTLDYLRGGSPAADAAIGAHALAVAQLTESRNALANLTAESTRRTAERADRDAVIAAAADRKPIPNAENVRALESDIAAHQALVTARAEHVAERRAEALALIAADAPARLKEMDDYSAQIVARAERAARELAEIGDEARDAASLRLVLEAVAEGSSLTTDGTTPDAMREGTLLWRRVSGATRYDADAPVSAEPGALLGTVLDRARYMAAIVAGGRPESPAEIRERESLGGAWGAVPSTSWAAVSYTQEIDE